MNADDFGLSPGVNRGIVEARKRGIVTSASLLVTGSAAAEAAACGREDPGLSLGLHVDLGEWTYRDGSWVPLRQVVPPEEGDAVALEIARQVETFRRLMGRDPTHLDSHQHVHLGEARPVFLRFARRLGIPLRSCTPAVRHCGDFHGQTGTGHRFPYGISRENLLRLVTSLEPGVTELCCHPGFADGLSSAYGRERELELEVLCDPAVRAVLARAGVVLVSFADVARDVAGGEPAP